MPTITIHKLKETTLKELNASDRLVTAIQEDDSQLTCFTSSSNVGDSHRTYARVFMDLDATVAEDEFAGKEGLAKFLEYFGEEDFRNDYELNGSSGFAGSYSPVSLAAISKAYELVDWSAFNAMAEETGECEVPEDVLVNYTKDLMTFLNDASKEPGIAVIVFIS